MKVDAQGKQVPPLSKTRRFPLNWKTSAAWIAFSICLLFLTVGIEYTTRARVVPVPGAPPAPKQIRVKAEANGTLSAKAKALAKRVSRISASRCAKADFKLSPYQVSLHFTYPSECKMVVKWGDQEYTRKWCDMHTCFDYSVPGCSALFTQANPVLKVYAYPPSKPYTIGSMQYHWERLLRGQHNGNWRLVESPREACVYVVTGFPDNVQNISHFNATAYGANHLLLGATAGEFHPAVHQDRPEPPFDSGDAMLARFNALPSSHRRGFDVQLIPFRANWMGDNEPNPYQKLRSAIALNESLSKMRSVDLLFKANIFHWPQVGWHARNLFLELLNNNWRKSKLVIMADVVCNQAFEYLIPPEEYTFWMMNAKFVFCPGGGGEFSWRFTETLAAGAVPIVMRSNLLPTGVNWDDCVVTTDLKSMHNLLSLLGTRYLGEWNERSRRCSEIFLSHFASLEAQLNTTISQVRAHILAGANSTAKGAMPLPCMRDLRK